MIASLSVVARVRAETGKRSGLGYVAEGPLGLLPMSSLGRSVSRKADGRAALYASTAGHPDGSYRAGSAYLCAAAAPLATPWTT
jgi:hypothetical protein